MKLITRNIKLLERIKEKNERDPFVMIKFSQRVKKHRLIMYLDVFNKILARIVIFIENHRFRRILSLNGIVDLKIN